MSLMETALRYLQRLLFDPPERPDAADGRSRAVLTPEERERRRRARERLRKRQRVLFQFRLPKRKRRRATSKSPRPRRPRPPRILKRQYKPLAHELYNLPGGLVDEIYTFDLSDRAQLSRAHAILDRLAREWADESSPVHAPEWIEDLPALHDALNRLATNAPEVSVEDAILREEWRQRAEEVQRGWTANHEIKANNYWQAPMELRPLKAEGVELQVRDIIE